MNLACAGRKPRRGRDRARRPLHGVQRASGRELRAGQRSAHPDHRWRRDGGGSQLRQPIRQSGAAHPAASPAGAFMRRRGGCAEEAWQECGRCACGVLRQAHALSSHAWLCENERTLYACKRKDRWRLRDEVPVSAVLSSAVGAGPLAMSP